MTASFDMSTEGAATAVYIANTAEAFSELLTASGDTGGNTEAIAREHTLSQRALFWGGDNKVVITPTVVPVQILDHATRILRWSNILNRAPAHFGIDLSTTIAADGPLMQSLGKLLSGRDAVLSAYCVTREFLELVAKFESMGVRVSCRERSLERSKWLRPYLDSKAGFRQMALSLFVNQDDVRIPEGFICSSEEEAVQVACWFLKSDRSCVIKANNGESGWGTVCLSAHDTPGNGEEHIRNLLRSDGIWANMPLIVEAFATPTKELRIAFPSVELFVGDSGSRITYACLQNFDAQGRFRGVLLGEHLLPARVSELASAAAAQIGTKYFRLGYRGYFDIDFLVGNDGNLYVLETNMRRTGGTHVYDMAKALRTAGYSPGYLLSEDNVAYGTQIKTQESFFENVNGLLFPIKGHPRGVFITAFSTEIPVFGYVVIGDTMGSVEALRHEIYELVSARGS